MRRAASSKWPSPRNDPSIPQLQCHCENPPVPATTASQRFSIAYAPSRSLVSVPAYPQGWGSEWNSLSHWESARAGS